MAKKEVIGGLLLVLLTASMYVILSSAGLRIDVEETKTEFKQYINDSWVLTSTERVWLMDGSTKMRAVNGREVIKNVVGDDLVITRNSGWKDNISIEHNYNFKGSEESKELFPIKETITVLNGVGKILVYEIRDFQYEGDTSPISSPFSYGTNMRLEWEGAYYAKVFDQISGDKIIVKFRVTEDNQTFSIRMFDPVTLTLEANPVELGTPVNISGTNTGTVCIDIDHPDFGVNVTCGTNSAWVDAEITSMVTDRFVETTNDVILEYDDPTNTTYNIEANPLDEEVNTTFELNSVPDSQGTPRVATLSSSNSAGAGISNEANIYDFNFSTFGTFSGDSDGDFSKRSYEVNEANISTYQGSIVGAYIDLKSDTTGQEIIRQPFPSNCVSFLNTVFLPGFAYHYELEAYRTTSTVQRMRLGCKFGTPGSSTNYYYDESVSGSDLDIYESQMYVQVKLDSAILNVYVGDELQVTIPSVRKENSTIDEFEQEFTTKQLNLDGDFFDETNVYVPADATINNATLRVVGGGLSLGDGSDGALVFTTSTKSYGSLTVDVDYTVSGNTLYLNTDQVYQFTSVNIGSGTTLRTNSTTGSILVIKSTSDMNITGDVNLTNVADEGDRADSFTTDGIQFNFPGTANGGQGGGNSKASQGNGFGAGGQGGYTGLTPCPSDNGYGTTGSTGSSTQGTGGLGATAQLTNDGCAVQSGGASTVGSAGGAGRSQAYLDLISGSVTVSATGGDGGDAYGSAGTDGDCSVVKGPSFNYITGLTAAGGGGAGGIAGKSGYNILLAGSDVNLSGNIDLSGTDGGDAGNGGKRVECDADGVKTVVFKGGYGGGGGAGGNSGDIFIYSETLSDTSSNTLTGGTGGTGGQQWDQSVGSYISSGQSGFSGSVGTVSKTTIATILNPKLEVGFIDNNPEWSYVGSYGGTETTDPFTTVLQNYINVCPNEVSEFCIVPISISSDSNGTLDLDTLDIFYDYDYGTIVLNLTSYLSQSDNVSTQNVPITFEVQNGGANISNPRYVHRGGNKSITITAHDPGYTSTDVENLSLIYSKTSVTQPNNVDFIWFQPRTASDSNVTPFGQEDDTPILNFTMINYANVSANFSAIINTSVDCVNITLSETSNKSDGTLLTINNASDWITYETDLFYNDSVPIWLWADFSCTASQWRFFEPQWYFRTCCETCLCDDEVS